MGHLDFRGKSVLDIGCGHGALSVYAAQQGAKRVLGIDIDSMRVDFACRNLEVNYPEFSSIISFHNGGLEEVTEAFDVALSKDSFEHIDDLPGMMRSIAKRLNDDGVLATGFSPLYFSPFGDHGRYWKGSRRIPWLPAILPESALCQLASRRRHERIQTASDVGLNKLTPAQFRSIIAEQGWNVISCETNKGSRPAMRVMRALSRLAPLEKYFTVNIYACLRKPAH
ncbi:class I SAM-dependent methyltransferase [Candidatus Mycolicibacterium alkanivorans]|uniref:Methyltransferase domain-containing protein n=1 Tax=Candidatus Mycolicibacterium alkanivorans TaxID=2954114 RepID=A0ABS9YQC9_9MYCO|nr:methyltransferase domain-containing protein [Candidatus Mycolicibacterium alkanivorans]